MGGPSVLLPKGQRDHFQNREGWPWVLLWSTCKGYCLEKRAETLISVLFDDRFLRYEMRYLSDCHLTAVSTKIDK